MQAPDIDALLNFSDPAAPGARLLALGRAEESWLHLARALGLPSRALWMREHKAPRPARVAQLAAYSSPPSWPPSSASSSAPSSSKTSAS